MPELPPDVSEAIKILQTFIDASSRDDLPGMLACVSARTAATGNLRAPSNDTTFVLDPPQMDGKQLIIPIKVMPRGGYEGAPPLMEMPGLMIKEDGQWKFDLVGAVDRIAPNLDQTVQQMATAVGEAMGKAMEGIGQAMADGLEQALGGKPADAPPQQDWSNASMALTSKELRPVPLPWKNLPKTQQSLTDAIGSNVIVVADMKRLLQRAGSDDADILLNWFDNQLFAGWGEAIERISHRLPLTGRLRAMRIESAASVEGRLLALDGSDLVYRMILPSDQGFYQDDQAFALLPGVLAGLPNEIDISATGFRLLPWDDEQVDLELYRETIAPRYMRRMSEYVGRNVALDADWDELGECDDVGRMLMLWGLNRIYGGLALTMMTSEARQQLIEEFRCIRIRLSYEVATGGVQYQDGTLDLSLRPRSGEAGAVYEVDIARSLSGQAAEPAEQQAGEPPATGPSEAEAMPSRRPHSKKSSASKKRSRNGGR